MFQRFGIDQHTTLQRIKKRARRAAEHLLSSGKKDVCATVHIYSHELEPKLFAMSFEELKAETLCAILLIPAEVLNFVRKNGRVFEVVDGVEIPVGRFKHNVSPYFFEQDKAPPNNVVSIGNQNGK